IYTLSLHDALPICHNRIARLLCELRPTYQRVNHADRATVGYPDRGETGLRGWQQWTFLITKLRAADFHADAMTMLMPLAYPSNRSVFVTAHSRDRTRHQ